MKAEDTVMSEGQLIEVIYLAVEVPDKDADESWKNKERFRAVCRAQAEITWGIAFKAGFKESLDTVVATGEYDEGKKAGIKEVVDWLKENHASKFFLNLGRPHGYDAMWQAKLKGWGIE